MLGLFGVLNSHLFFTREAFPTSAYKTLGNLAPAPRAVDAGSPGAGRGAPEGMCVGDPAHIERAVKRWESIGVDQINFMLNVTEVIPQQQVLDSLRLFAREVMPAFGVEPSEC